MSDAGRDAELLVILKKLGHYYDDAPSGTVAKMLAGFAERLAEVRDLLEALPGNRFYATADGTSLDLLGAGLHVGREEGEVDTDYRDRLLLEVLIRTSSGQTNELRTIVAWALGIPAESIKIFWNESPSMAEPYLPFFAEISMNWSVLVKTEEKVFKFAHDPLVSTFDSERGFNSGPWKSRKTRSALVAEAQALLERILPVGVQYVIGAHGGFKFSHDPLVSTFDSERGFNSGAWRGQLA